MRVGDMRVGDMRVGDMRVGDAWQARARREEAAWLARRARGLIGLYTTNKSFQIDDVRVGDPQMKPVQLTLTPHPPAYTAEAGDPPLLLTSSPP
ncbi:hypothetical protein [Massilia genomosp. 1]|uniref:Uncharacterized protein n=1 Tax=Massilia genomosp. 1 TaxID=2609280 RepID=A0ABX0N1J1_9BURK|nr:hypothetical protein [Massilia genomosp. 1]NHZ66538.1 hypothetical protein [Massilia genomosp. 1]